MATFTMPLWQVLELTEDNGEGHAIGLADYPIPAGWTGDFRGALNAKIIRHYWNREIGMETIAMFTYAMYRRMHEVMPLYVQLYESQMLAFDPLSTVKLTTTRDDETTEQVNRTRHEEEASTGTSHGTNSTIQDSTTTGTATQGSRAINSEFPQLLLAGNEDYASSGADSHGTSGSTGVTHGTGSGITDESTGSTGNTDGTEATDGTTHGTGTSTTAGYQSNPSDLLARYRATFLNVDMLVLADLADCFLQVWDNGDEYQPSITAMPWSNRLDIRL